MYSQFYIRVYLRRINFPIFTGLWKDLNEKLRSFFYFY